jgi:hypothetical protein
MKRYLILFTLCVTAIWAQHRPGPTSKLSSLLSRIQKTRSRFVQRSRQISAPIAIRLISDCGWGAEASEASEAGEAGGETISQAPFSALRLRRLSP